MKKICANNGFSLVELIVVFVVIGFLSRIGLVSFNSIRCKTRENIARLALKNIQKECEANRYLKTEELFTQVNVEGYELIPGNSNKCSGNEEDGSISLMSITGCDNYSFSLDPLTGNIKEFLEEKIDPSKFKNITPNISNATCGGYPDPFYNPYPGGINPWSGPHRAVDGDTRFDWHCEGNHEISFDLGKEMVIDKLETFHQGGRAKNMVEIYIDGKLIKKEPNWRDDNGRLDGTHGTFRKTWSLNNVKGRSITYRTIRMSEEEWCDANFRSEGCNRENSEWTNIADINVIAQ